MKYPLLPRYFVAGFASGLPYTMYCLCLQRIGASSRVPSVNLMPIGVRQNEMSFRSLGNRL
jgi:hypothetical protein